MSEAIHNLIDNILLDQGAEAQETFQDIMALKITDALDAHKVAIAQHMGSAHEVPQA